MAPTAKELNELNDLTPRMRAAMEFIYEFMDWWDTFDGEGQPGHGRRWRDVEEAYESYEALRGTP